MTDDHFLGETLRPEPNVTPTVTDGDLTCCLCDELIRGGPIVGQRFEADPLGRTYSAHVSCARTYALALKAFRRALWSETPKY